MYRVWVLLCVMLFCGSTRADTQAGESQKDPFKVGVVYGLTGPADVWASYGRMGLELAAAEINERGGVNGRPLTLIFEDSKTNPTQSVSAYRKLVTVDKVHAVIGDVWDFITNPLIPLSTRDKVVLLSPTVMPHSIEQRADYYFTLGHKVEGLRTAVSTFFEKEPAVKTVSILCWEDAWGHGYLGLWKEVAKKKGVEILSEDCTNNFGSDFRAEVLKISAKKPDAVIVARNPELVSQRMREIGFKALILSASDVVEALKVRKAAPALLEGVYFTDWVSSREFQTKFENKYHTVPILEAQNHFDALYAVSKAFEKNTPDLLQALRTVKFRGVEGPIDFTQGPFANETDGQLYKVEDGKFRLIQ